MTTQWPDSCTFEGRRWVIEQWEGARSCIPTNEQLDIKTETRSTANWSGRIDHFLIHHDVLHLFKIEVTRPAEEEGKCPIGARREIVLRYEPIEVFDFHQNESQVEVREQKTEYLVFDKLVIPFTGLLHLSYPFFDYWEVPWPFRDEEEREEAEAMVLSFENGLLLDAFPP
jgi:hypothetical protein